jgi:3-oxoacyl-[acyl-carrier-protein] synthase III
MAKRSLGELNDSQRKVLNVWAHQMAVSEDQMVNILNNVDNHRAASPWDNLDEAATVVHDCPDC